MLEWNRGKDFEGLLLALQREKKPATLLLTGIVPRHVGFDPGRLREAAAAAGHVVLATTDAPRAAWKLSGEEVFWMEVSAERLFDVSTLVTELVVRVSAIRAQLPEGVLREAWEPDLSTLCGVTLRDLAAAASSESRRVEKWFHTVLAPHEQLLALGLAFFDGLADDQLLGAVERWVAQVRAQRDPAQHAYDYADVDDLESFFAIVGGDAGGTRIESRWPDLRRALLRAAWRSHRRQVLAALPLLTGLVVQSTDRGEKDQELYGTADRRFQVRRSVGEALSDVGLISVAAVEPALVRLACEGSAEVQTVAARATARWREHGGHAQLFDLIDRWYEDRRIHDMADDFLAGRASERKRGIDAHLRATIAIAVGHAAQHDPPGQLAPRLIARIRQLGGDRNASCARASRPRCPCWSRRTWRSFAPSCARWRCTRTWRRHSAWRWPARTSPRRARWKPPSRHGTPSVNPRARPCSTRARSPRATRCSWCSPSPTARWRTRDPAAFRPRRGSSGCARSCSGRGTPGCARRSPSPSAGRPGAASIAWSGCSSAW